MALVGWMALASAAVVALGPQAAAAFAVLAVGLVAVTTLFLTLRWGVGVAVVALATFVVATAAGATPPWLLAGDDLPRLLRTLVRWQTLAPDLVTAAALAGTVACAELASAGLEWDMVLRSAVGPPRQSEETAAEPKPSTPEMARHDDARRLRSRSRRSVRQEEA
jgi:hypothetical protein